MPDVPLMYIRHFYGQYLLCWQTDDSSPTILLQLSSGVLVRQV